MMMKYIERLQKIHYRGLIVLALTLGPAFTFATPTLATVTGHAATGNSSGACASATPGLSLTPSSQQAEGGTSLAYTVSITNNDDKACSGSRFDLTVTYLPSGWTGDLSTNTLNLMPGATGTATLSVIAAGNATANSSKVQVAVSGAQDAVHARAATVSQAANDTATEVANSATAVGPKGLVAGQTTNLVNPLSAIGANNIAVTGSRVARKEIIVPASGGASATDGSNAQYVERLTLRLNGLLTAYNQASGSAKAQVLKELVSLANERHALLANLIADNPGSVLQTAVPNHIRDAMPVEVRALIEQRANLEGKLDVVYQDYSDGHARLQQFLEANGKRIALHFKGKPPALRSGATVNVSGVLLNDSMASEIGINQQSQAGSIEYCCTNETTQQTTTSTSTALTHTTGDQHTLVLLVNFLDTASSTPFTVTQAQDTVFNTVNKFYQENSSGQTSLSGDVYGWYTLPVDSTCDGDTISTAADAAAMQSGVSLSSYVRIIYVFDGTAACGWSGAAGVGDYPSKAWINGNLDPKVIAHELGHNLGLNHAMFLDCDTAVLGSSCEIALDDKFDTMGSAIEPGHFNAYEKERLGWFKSGELLTVTSDGSYTLAPYELGSGVKAIKIMKETDPAGQGASWYYLEYRQAVGFDSYIAGNYNVLNGALVRTGKDYDLLHDGGSYLLDMTPNSSVLDFQNRSDPALVIGQSFTDPGSGLFISTTMADISGATVDISFAAPTCVPANPLVAISPSEAPWVVPGSPVTYAVTVTNADSTACSDGTFDLSSSVPNGWVSSFDDSQLTITPGASATAALTVTSPSSATDGFYDIVAIGTNRQAPTYGGSATASYVISSTTVDQAPVAVDDSGTTDSAVPVTIPVLANDYDPDGDGLSVAAVSQGVHGTVTNNGGGTVTYTPDARFSGSDVFQYTVSDGVGTATANVAVLVQKKKKGGGKPR